MRTTARARKISDLTVGELQDIIRNTIHEVVDPRRFFRAESRSLYDEVVVVVHRAVGMADKVEPFYDLVRHHKKTGQ